MTTTRAKAEKLTHTLYAMAMKLIIEGPTTSVDIAEETGLHLNTCRGFLRALKKKEVVHICGWDKDALGRDQLMIYGLGPGTDVVRRRQTPSQRTKVYRSRVTQRLLQAASAGAAA